MTGWKARSGRDPGELSALDLEKHLSNSDLKRKYVATMFDILAPGYDSFTRLFSFGMDRGWKEKLIAEGARRAVREPRLLDLACGTGDLGLALGARTRAKFAVGLDLSPVMLSEAATRMRSNGGAALPLQLVAGDMGRLCVPSASMDVVSVGYGFRNTPDPRQAIAEAARVLRPGGLLLNLDFFRPAMAVWRELFLAYLSATGNAAGWLWHREPVVYGYIAHSIRRFMTIAEFEAALAAAGFAVEWRATHLGGGIALHAAKRLST